MLSALSSWTLPFTTGEKEEMWWQRTEKWAKGQPRVDSHCYYRQSHLLHILCKRNTGSLQWQQVSSLERALPRTKQFWVWAKGPGLKKKKKVNRTGGVSAWTVYLLRTVAWLAQMLFKLYSTVQHRIFNSEQFTRASVLTLCYVLGAVYNQRPEWYPGTGARRWRKGLLSFPIPASVSHLIDAKSKTNCN